MALGPCTPGNLVPSAHALVAMSKPPPLTWGIIQAHTPAGGEQLPANTRESMQHAYMQAVPSGVGGYVFQHMPLPSFMRRLF